MLLVQVEYLDDASLTGFVAEDVVQVSDFKTLSPLPFPFSPPTLFPCQLCFHSSDRWCLLRDAAGRLLREHSLWMRD